MTGSPGSPIPIASVPNLRDIGGWPTDTGQSVRRGLAYRSTELNSLSDDDLPAFSSLEIGVIIDLRTEQERTAQPDRVVGETAYIHLDILADSNGADPAELLEILRDPSLAMQVLSHGAADLLSVVYRELVTLPSAISGYQQLFTELASTTPDRPALFHCTTGKDRTGWAAAALLLWLGVSEEVVMKEYLLTNQQLLPAMEPLMDQFVAAGGERNLLTPILGVDPSYLEAAMDEMSSHFGSIDIYFADGLGLDADTLVALRSRFLD